MLKAIVATFNAFWSIINAPNNEPVTLGLLFAVLALLLAFVHSWWVTRKLLKDKDARIEDLVKERNRLQDALLAVKGIRRQTTVKK